MLMDLNRFKEINDTLGHPAGDQILVMVAQRLSTTLRDADTLARLGGDEFGILLPDVMDGRKTAEEVAKNFCNASWRPSRSGTTISTWAPPSAWSSTRSTARTWTR